MFCHIKIIFNNTESKKEKHANYIIFDYVVLYN